MKSSPTRIGATVFFTGLPGAGKSTVASLLRTTLVRRGLSDVTLLDGDVVRRQLSPDLGFSRADRDLHIQRIAELARETAARGGISICAVIAPYAVARRRARQTLEPAGRFLLVYISTPREVCEARDPKGYYARARRGALQSFTGISDPYEPPADADLVIDTSRKRREESVQMILDRLEDMGMEIGAQTKD